MPVQLEGLSTDWRSNNSLRGPARITLRTQGSLQPITQVWLRKDDDGSHLVFVGEQVLDDMDCLCVEIGVAGQEVTVALRLHGFGPGASPRRALTPVPETDPRAPRAITLVEP